MDSKNVPLSASRIKTLQTCSWLYFSKYYLRLPDSQNLGSIMGSTCHNVFECLGNPRHKKHYYLAIAAEDSFASPVIKRYVELQARKMGIYEEANLNKMNSMILAGLQYDFFGTKNGKPTLSISEQDFDVEVKEGNKNYRILGFIDKLFLFKKKSLAIIRDFKTSKQVFKGEEVTDNMQHLMYSLAVKHLYPEYLKRDMEFLFLQFDCNKEGLVEMHDVSPEELEGFELYLTEIQEMVNNFNEETAVSNFAYDKGFPKPEEGFAGRLVCGMAKEKGQLKKDGTPMWACSMRFPFEYFKVVDSAGRVVKSFFTKEEAEKFCAGKDLKWEMDAYSGCKRFEKMDEKKVDKYDPFL